MADARSETTVLSQALTIEMMDRTVILIFVIYSPASLDEVYSVTSIDSVVPVVVFVYSAVASRIALPIRLFLVIVVAVSSRFTLFLSYLLM